MLGLAGLLTLATTAPQAATTFTEAGGRVVMEAEHFDSRLDNADGHKWQIVPDEGTGSAQGSVDRTNARNGRYMQSLPDVIGGGVNHNTAGDEDTPPSMNYKMKITTTGTYHLYLKWGGYDGSSDSVYAQLLEVTTPGVYRFSNLAGSTDFNLIDWQGIAGADVNDGGPDATDGPATFTIATAGTYTLQLSMREDGSAVDAIVFQLDSLPAPSGLGFAESATEGNTLPLTAPVISRQIGDTAGYVGGGAAFSVGVSNNVVPTSIKWFKNNTEIPGATDLTYSTDVLALTDNGAKYKVTLSNSAGSVTSREAVLTVVAVTEKPGTVKVDVFMGIAGTAVGDLTNNPAFPNNPTSTEFTKFLEYPPGGDDGTPPGADIFNNYGTHLTGFLIPKQTADYTFYIASDDNSSFYLSTDANPSNKKLIAWEPQWNPVRDFSTNTRRPGCDATPADCENISDPIHLVANQRYYFEGFHKEGGGGDNFAVAWSSDGSVPDTSSIPIGSDFLLSIIPDLAIVQHPQDLSVEESRSGTFSVSPMGPGGYTYQWQLAPAGGTTFTDISGATSSTLAVTALKANNGNQYRVTVAAGGKTVTSNSGTLTVAPDVTPPKMVAAGSDPGGVVVYFSEDVGPGANVAGNYTLSGGATVSSATQVGPGTVFLQTAAPLTAGTSYTLTVNGVKDIASGGGNAVSPNTIAVKGSPALPTPLNDGLVKYERWENLSPSDIPTLISTIAAGTAPDVSKALIAMEYDQTANPPEGANVDNFGARLSGFFIPPADGNYVFSGCSDDNGRLYLSTDSDPANKKWIASQPSWDNYRTWTSGYPDKHSDTFAGTEWPTGHRISLKGGQPYYLEWISQEGGGGDDDGVTYWKEGDPVPGNGTPSAVQGAVIRGNIAAPTTGAPIVAPVSIANPLFNKGDTITLTTKAFGAGLSYQWYRNKMPIAGATSATLTINNADYHAIGDYSLKVTNAEGSTQSNDRSGDDVARLLLPNAFLIEAEDYNYGGGKTKPEASVMPYLGNAYLGLAATLDTDFHNDGDESAGAAFSYNRDVATDAGVVEMKGPGDPVDTALGRYRGSFSVTNNYAVGWGTDGDWQNYTRTFPKGKYVIIGATAQDGVPDETDPTMKSTLSKVTGANTATQTVTDLGTFISPKSGAWSSNDLNPLTDASGNVVQVDLDGETTLRWTNNSGEDQDFLLLYCLDCSATPPPAPTLSIAVSAGNMTVTSDTAGTTLETTDALGTTWTPLGTAPQTVPITGKAKFIRGKK